MIDLRYLSYVLCHKWFVFWECLKLDVPLWIALIHDWDKFTPFMFWAYARHFGGYRNAPQPSTGYIKADDTADKTFNRAVEMHVKRNKHHWEYYVRMSRYTNQVRPIRMPDVFVREMVADWRGAGKAQGTPDNRAWYLKNKDRLQLHAVTRARVEQLLGISRATV